MKRSLRASQAAHRRLERVNKVRYERSGYKEVYQQKALYHGHVILLQRNKKRKLNPAEKERAFADVIKNFY